MARTDKDNGYATERRSTSSSVPEISLGNVFLFGRQKMVKMKIPLVREKKKARINRSGDFFLEINNNVLKKEDDIEGELDRITNVQLFNPWRRSVYRAVSD